MSHFEFIFSLLSLLLGFVLVEVLRGFVRAIKAGRTHGAEDTPIRVGVLTRLLAVFVMMDVASYWALAWDLRDSLPIGPDTVFAGLLISGTYYFSASMIFPDDLKEWPNLDEWFWTNRRRILACIIALNCVTVATMFFASGLKGPVWGHAVEQGIYFVPLIIAAWSRNRWLVGSMLGLLIFCFLLAAVGTLVGRLI